MGVYDTMKAVADTLADKANNVKSAGVDALRSTLNEINSVFADLEGVGYHVTDVELAVGLPPSITVYLVKQGQATDEAFAALLANYRGRKTASTLISLVRQADQWAGALCWGDRRCRMVAVELGIRPAVRLVYSGQQGAMTTVSPIEQQVGEAGAASAQDAAAGAHAVEHDRHEGKAESLEVDPGTATRLPS